MAARRVVSTAGVDTWDLDGATRGLMIVGLRDRVRHNRSTGVEVVVRATGLLAVSLPHLLLGLAPLGPETRQTRRQALRLLRAVNPRLYRRVAVWRPVDRRPLGLPSRLLRRVQRRLAASHRRRSARPGAASTASA